MIRSYLTSLTAQLAMVLTLAVGAMPLMGAQVQAATVDLTPVDQGRISRFTGGRFNPRVDIIHDPNSTSLSFPTTSSPFSASSNTAYRGYLIFDLPTFSDPISEVALTFDVAIIDSGLWAGTIKANSIEGDYAVFDQAFDEERTLVPMAETPNYQAASAFYEDLSDGSRYGETGLISGAPSVFMGSTGNGTYTILFSAAGVADVAAAQGQRFAIGLDGTNARYTMSNPTLSVSTVPLPASALLLLAGIGGLAAYGRRKTG